MASSSSVVHLMNPPSFPFNLTRSSSSKFNYPFPPPPPIQNNNFKLKNLAFLKDDSNSYSLHQSHLKIISTKSTISASTAIVEDTSTTLSTAAASSPKKQKKLGVLVKPMNKPKLVLKFIWMEKNIGIAVDQVIPGHGTIPLSPYYFWPRKDAWEELKLMLETKAWVTQKEMVILLNQATDIINLWQQSGGDLS